ncbi:hypothetical protein BH11ARM2_BH11ARM2_34950 [soil metagenome]
MFRAAWSLKPGAVSFTEPIRIDDVTFTLNRYENGHLIPTESQKINFIIPATNAVPEPASLAVLAVAALPAVARKRRKSLRAMEV